MAASSSSLKVGGSEYEIFRLDSLQASHDVARLPFTLRILLENALRTGTEADVEAVAGWVATDEPSRELSFTPARVLHQDFTGVPAVVDLVAMRDAMRDLGGDPARIDPELPSNLVIDHSVQVDAFASRGAMARNTELEFERNRERYAFLRFGQQAFDGLTVVPPATGIVHQVNLEFLARVVQDRNGQAFPDTLLGTDSHTTMVNGLGVLGWGVGGIEAEAAMLGEAVSMLVPQVVGFRLTGKLPDGSTATDLVLTVTQILRETGVVGKFVEYFGAGLEGLPVADRATLGNMSPEYGATCGFFPVDEETLAYLRLTGRAEEHVALVEAYCKENMLWHDPADGEPTYSQIVELDLSTVEPSLAGPRRPQDRVPLRDAKESFLAALPTFGIDYGTADDAASAESFPASDPMALASPGHEESQATATVSVPDTGERSHAVWCELDGERFPLDHGAVVIAAITSCTNTSNPQVMVAAGLLAKKAVERGLQRRPWVKSSLAPGSKVVTQYLDEAGLSPHLDELGFQTVGYGCTTCIGNSGPLPDEISRAISEGDLAVVAVLSGNRNFEARIHPEVKANYLASPPLVVAYALAGRMDLDLVDEPLGTGEDGEDVYLKDIWPSPQEVQEVIGSALRREMFEQTYADVYTGDERWRALDIPSGLLYEWDPKSTYIRRPPYFDGMGREPEPVGDIARRPLPRHGGRLRDDRPHLARGRHQAGQPGRPLPRGARHRAQGLQLVWLPPRQPRGDDPRHVRQRPAAQPARPRLGGDVDGASALRRRDDDLRGGRALPRGGRAARRHRRQGVRLGIVTRLGREGPGAARRARGARRELRAHPPLQSADDGRPAAAVRRRRGAGGARADRPRALLGRGRRRRRGPHGDRAGRRP